MRLIAWPLTDVGRVRVANEDSFLVDDTLGLYLVADGMGGHAGGALASQTCVEVMKKSVQRGIAGKEALPADAEPQLVDEMLDQAAREASARIFDHGMREPGLAGMGTTLTGMLVRKNQAHIVHIGDSRCYLIRDNEVTQLTNDHSWLNEQVQAGFMSQAEAEKSDLRHIITRSVGFERAVQADVFREHVLPGDVFLLCSDGLSNYLSDDEIATFAQENYYADLPSVCTQCALDRGGDDNITVVVVLACNDQDERQFVRQERQTALDSGN